MVGGVKAVAAEWKYDAVSVGYPGPVLHGRPVLEPRHLGRGWVGFDYRTAFGCPVKVVNDAAMQGLGSYRDGKMLFLGLGTGLGSAMAGGGMGAPDGRRPPAVPGRHVRAVRRIARVGDAWARSMAPRRRGRRRSPHRRARARGRRPRGRQRSPTRDVAAWLPRRRQRKCLRRRFPPVGATAQWIGRV